MLYWKRSKRGIAILAVLAMLLTLIPLGSVAFASGTYEALNVVTVPDGAKSDLGTILARVTAGSLGSGIVNIRLPNDYTYDWANLGVDGSTNEIVNEDYLFNVPQEYSGDKNGFWGVDFKAIKIADNEIQLRPASTAGAVYLNSNDGYLYIYLKQIAVPAGKSGAVKVVFEPPSSSGFPKGEVQVANVTGGEVLITVDEVKTFTDTSAPIILRFKETAVNSWEPGARTMKLRLPSGFEWAATPTLTTSDILWGKAWSTQWIANNISFEVDGRDLYVNVSDTPASGVNYGAGLVNGKVQTPGIYFKLPVRVSVADETVAKYGNVEISISGQTDRNISSLVIAKYGEMATTVKVEGATQIIAGQTEQEIGQIVIEETAPGTLIVGRTISLTLPANAKWGQIPNVSTEQGLQLSNARFSGDDGRTIKWEIDTASTDDPGKITLKEGEIIVAGDTSGDITVELGGTANVTGKIVVATAVTPINVTASSKGQVVTGVNDQPAGDIVIKENAKEALSKDKQLEISLPLGVTFTSEPKIEVTEGDVDLDEGNIRLTNDDRTLSIPISGESTKPSTVVISGIKYDVDRNVAQGDIEVKIGGSAVNEVNDVGELRSYLGVDSTGTWFTVGGERAFRYSEDGAFPAVSTVARVVNAVCITSATGTGTGGKATFTIGSTGYTVNDKQETMDVAPYIKDGRTYLPIRYVGLALGVDPSNIIWDGTKATLIKGDKVVQVAPGSKVMVINAASITMDVVPEITNGRIMLPFRWIAQAFGAKVNWNSATQTVDMEL